MNEDNSQQPKVELIRGINQDIRSNDEPNGSQIIDIVERYSVTSLQNEQIQQIMKKHSQQSQKQQEIKVMEIQSLIKAKESIPKEQMIEVLKMDSKIQKKKQSPERKKKKCRANISAWD